MSDNVEKLEAPEVAEPQVESPVEGAGVSTTNVEAPSNVEQAEHGPPSGAEWTPAQALLIEQPPADASVDEAPTADAAAINNVDAEREVAPTSGEAASETPATEPATEPIRLVDSDGLAE